MDDTPARKLARLLESASSEDREAITAWLLDRRAGSWMTEVRAPEVRVRYGSLLGELGEGWSRADRSERLRGALTPGEESQLVTLRLPQERHAELRRWCTGHDFSMAAVIRGLVERFLEAQAEEPQPAQADPAGEATAR